jgi:hypothetical protein
MLMLPWLKEPFRLLSVIKVIKRCVSLFLLQMALCWSVQETNMTNNDSYYTKDYSNPTRFIRPGSSNWQTPDPWIPKSRLPWQSADSRKTHGERKGGMDVPISARDVSFLLESKEEVSLTLCSLFSNLPTSWSLPPFFAHAHPIAWRPSLTFSRSNNWWLHLWEKAVQYCIPRHVFLLPVKGSQPWLLWLPAVARRTVNEVFSINTPCFAQFSRYPCLGLTKSG